MKILLAVDGSAHSDEAVHTVASRPWPIDTTVRVLSVAHQPVLRSPPEPAWTAFGMPVAPDEHHLRSQAALIVQRATETLRTHGLHTETSVRVGDPRTEIVDAAEEWGADLIVLGSRGLTGIKRWVLGSVAQSVVSHASCSVEVVHERREGGESAHASGA